MSPNSKSLKYSIYCDPKFEKPNKSIIRTSCDMVFDTNKISNADISFIFCVDELLLDFKKKYFKKNHFTDVIAFNMNENNKKAIEGEIYISLERALENSNIYNEPFEKEIIRLVIHGCLHLIGFDDKNNLEKKIMTNMEDDFLSKINWEGLLLNE